jgi:hypothetical protein
MKYHFDLHGHEPIIRDVPVTDTLGSGYIPSVTLNAGALMNQGATLTCTGVSGYYSTVKLAYDLTVNAMATNCIGVLLETPISSGTCAPLMTSVSSTQGGATYGKVIINPGAVYLVEQKTDTSNDVTVVRNSGVTIESVCAGTDGYYIYFPVDTAGVKGSLRYIYAASGTGGTMSKSLTTTATTSDSFILISPPFTRALALDTTARYVTGGTAAVTGGTTNLMVLESYIDRDAGLEILKPTVHGFSDSLHNVKGGNGPKFYYDVVMKSHLLGNSL